MRNFFLVLVVMTLSYILGREFGNVQVAVFIGSIAAIFATMVASEAFSTMGVLPLLAIGGMEIGVKAHLQMGGVVLAGVVVVFVGLLFYGRHEKMNFKVAAKYAIIAATTMALYLN